MQKEATDKLIEQFKQVGLGDKAAVVYMVLLELGGGYPSKIAEEAKLNRSTTYKILLDLSIKGLVNELKKRNKIYYQVEKAGKLMHFAKEQVRLSEDRLEKAQKLIPELEGLFSLTFNKPRVRFFEGEQEIIELYRDHVDVDKPYEMLAFSNITEIAKFLPRKFRDEYIAAKNRLGISSRGIVPDNPDDIRYSELVYPGVKKKVKPFLRHVPAEKFPFKCEITIYGEKKVSVQNFSDDGLVGVIIEDQLIHDMMSMIFELAWVGAESLYPEIGKRFAKKKGKVGSRSIGDSV